MRRNAFNEAYASTPAELTEALAEYGIEPSDVYADIDSTDDPDKSKPQYQAEVRENDSGDTVCWVEGSTYQEVEDILTVAGVEIDE